jgi:hypothetical protein
MKKQNKNKKGVSAEFFYGANSAEVIHKTQVQVRDPFPYINTTKGVEYIVLDGREYEIVKKRFKSERK